MESVIRGGGSRWPLRRRKVNSTIPIYVLVHNAIILKRTKIYEYNTDYFFPLRMILRPFSISPEKFSFQIAQLGILGVFRLSGQLPQDCECEIWDKKITNIDNKLKVYSCKFSGNTNLRFKKWGRKIICTITSHEISADNVRCGRACSTEVVNSRWTGHLAWFYRSQNTRPFRINVLETIYNP